MLISYLSISIKHYQFSAFEWSKQFRFSTASVFLCYSLFHCFYHSCKMRLPFQPFPCVSCNSVLNFLGHLTIHFTIPTPPILLLTLTMRHCQKCFQSENNTVMWKGNLLIPVKKCLLFNFEGHCVHYLPTIGFLEVTTAIRGKGVLKCKSQNCEHWVLLPSQEYKHVSSCCSANESHLLRLSPCHHEQAHLFFF